MKKSIKIILSIIGIIILLFIIDLICIFTFDKPIIAIKKDNGDTVNVVYKGLIYDTYICHEYAVPQIKLKGTKFACTHINIKERKESTYVVTYVENVNISISNISPTGATITIKDTNNKPYTYGEWYVIEKQINDKWYKVDTIIDNYGFTSIGYTPNKNNELKIIIDWEWLYGKLTLGNYRILKKAGTKHISVEFSISKTS